MFFLLEKFWKYTKFPYSYYIQQELVTSNGLFIEKW